MSREKIEIFSVQDAEGNAKFKYSKVRELEKYTAELEEKVKVAVEIGYKALDLIDLRERSTVIDEYEFYDNVRDIRKSLSTIKGDK